MKKMKLKPLFAAMFVTLTLTACGGGGSGSDDTNPGDTNPTDTNPTDTNPEEKTQAAVWSVTTRDFGGMEPTSETDGTIDEVSVTYTREDGLQEYYLSDGLIRYGSVDSGYPLDGTPEYVRKWDYPNTTTTLPDVYSYYENPNSGFFQKQTYTGSETDYTGVNTDANGNTVSSARITKDEQGRTLTKTLYAADQTTKTSEFTYEYATNVSDTPSGGYYTLQESINYDVNGNVTYFSRMTHEYDNQGNITSQISWSRDSNGDLYANSTRTVTNTYYPDGDTFAGKLKSKETILDQNETQTNLDTLNYSYETLANGNIKMVQTIIQSNGVQREDYYYEIETPDGLLVESGRKLVSDDSYYDGSSLKKYTYNSDGNVTYSSFDYDGNGVLNDGTYTGETRVETTYDSDGRVATVTTYRTGNTEGATTATPSEIATTTYYTEKPTCSELYTGTSVTPPATCMPTPEEAEAGYVSNSQVLAK